MKTAINGLTTLCWYLGLGVVVYCVSGWLAYQSFFREWGDAIDRRWDDERLTACSNNIDANDYIEALSLYGEVLGELGEGHVMNAKVKRALCFGFALCLVGCIKAKTPDNFMNGGNEGSELIDTVKLIQ